MKEKEGNKRRHKWHKTYFRGKYSTFEISAICIMCGCERNKFGIIYEYIMENGEYSIGKVPPCILSSLPQLEHKVNDKRVKLI